MENSFDNFKREIDLIIRQNPLECELYSIIAFILRSCNSSENISIRDVTNLTNQASTHNPRNRQFQLKNGRFASADFLIIDTQYEYSKRQREYILGCCEIKAIYCDIDKAIRVKKDQFSGELGRYKKLIYTNGLEWRYYESKVYNDREKPSWIIQLGEYNLHRQGVARKISDQDFVNWNDSEKWNDLLNKLKGINWHS